MIPGLPAGGGRQREGAAAHVADTVVIGAGVAGLSTALELARIAPGVDIALLTRYRLGEHGASPLAQGGIAAALDPADSPARHAEDTEDAAAGLGRRGLIDLLTGEGPGRVRELIGLGARFDRDASGELALGLEGAHSRKRILHADGDRTGAEVTRALAAAARERQEIRVFEGVEAVELAVSAGCVVGVRVESREGGLQQFRADATVLATGGPGRIYSRTTAPAGLDGDGLAMAARAGARLRDLEFVQFHPTALDVSADPLPLVTEALRGAGARLVGERGSAIPGVEAEGGELASRDRVSRALWRAIEGGQRPFLDARPILEGEGAARFPGAVRTCRRFGIDASRELIPVTPAAHYHMGGVAVDADGRSSVEGLWAVGEVACSGLHGANRLASNSLLEGLVFGARVARALVGERSGASDPADAGARARPSAPARYWESGGTLPPEVRLRIRTLMWKLAGVVRSASGLAKAVDSLAEIEREVSPSIPASRRNLLLAARMVAHAARARTESVGSHYRADAPEGPGGAPRHSVLQLAWGNPATMRVGLEAEPVPPESHG
ncbi:MAG: L-aspartate oxidase [Gammaproteobacteria bacterium]|nr:L-aspartate oxidase [Gammaproteobacteria bacterium]